MRERLDPSGAIREFPENHYLEKVTQSDIMWVFWENIVWDRTRKTDNHITGIVCFVLISYGLWWQVPSVAQDFLVLLITSENYLNPVRMNEFRLPYFSMESSGRVTLVTGANLVR